MTLSPAPRLLGRVPALGFLHLEVVDREGIGNVSLLPLLQFLLALGELLDQAGPFAGDGALAVWQPPPHGAALPGQ